RSLQPTSKQEQALPGRFLRKFSRARVPQSKVFVKANFDKFRGSPSDPQCREDPRTNRELTLENPDGCLGETPKVTGLEGGQQQMQLWNLFVPVSPKLLVRATESSPMREKGFIRFASIFISIFLLL